MTQAELLLIEFVRGMNEDPDQTTRGRQGCRRRRGEWPCNGRLKDLDLASWCASSALGLSPERHPQPHHAVGARVALLTDLAPQLPTVLTTFIPAGLQISSIWVEDTFLACGALNVRKGLAGHIFAHGLTTQVELFGDLENFETLRL